MNDGLLVDDGFKDQGRARGDCSDFSINSCLCVCGGGGVDVPLVGVISLVKSDRVGNVSLLVPIHKSFCSRPHSAFVFAERCEQSLA